MKKLTYLAVTFALFAFSACGEKTEEKFQYNLTENGCSTGEQVFESKAAYCAALKNDAQNQYCAHSLRQRTFEDNCPGSFFD